MAFGILAEALLRIEHKLDLILTAINTDNSLYPPMGFIGLDCPVCKHSVSYSVDIAQKVATRKCKCTSGKIPPTFDLFNLPGEKNAPSRKPSESIESTTEAEVPDRNFKGQPGPRILDR